MEVWGHGRYRLKQERPRGKATEPLLGTRKTQKSLSSKETVLEIKNSRSSEGRESVSRGVGIETCPAWWTWACLQNVGRTLQVSKEETVTLERQAGWMALPAGMPPGGGGRGPGAGTWQLGCWHLPQAPAAAGGQSLRAGGCRGQGGPVAQGWGHRGSHNGLSEAPRNHLPPMNWGHFPSCLHQGAQPQDGETAPWVLSWHRETTVSRCERAG